MIAHTGNYLRTKRCFFCKPQKNFHRDYLRRRRAPQVWRATPTTIKRCVRVESTAITIPMPHTLADTISDPVPIVSMSVSTDNHVQIGGRKSELAQCQNNIVRALIEKEFPELSCDVLALNTLGDQVLNKPLYSFGGKLLWTKELEILLVEGVGQYPRLDLIVHSLKDMPTTLPDEFELGCILHREDPRDALVMKAGSPYKLLADLPAGLVVGTLSIRRLAQLLRNYPHLKFESVRGNVHTRLAKLDDPEGTYSCLMLANAGLTRLGLAHRITTLLDAPDMYYAVGQGALGIEIRKGDEKMKNILKRLEDLPTTLCCLAERSLMRYLEGGCSVPLGVKTNFDEESNQLSLKACIVSPDGTKVVEDGYEMRVTTKEDAEALGIKVGDLLIAKGGRDILAAIDFTRINQRPNILSDGSATSSPAPASPALNSLAILPSPAQAKQVN